MGWAATRVRECAVGDGAPDLVVQLEGPGDERALLLFEASRSAYPRDVRAAMARVCRWSARGVVVFVAPFLGVRAQSILAEAGVGYLDLTGNVRVSVTSPAFFLSDRGASVNPWPEAGQLRSLAGAAAARVVRTLCDVVPPYGAAELAERAGVSPGYVSKILAALVREDLIERRPRGPVVGAAWRQLLEAWARDYDLLRSNVARLYLAPRGLDDVLARLRGMPEDVRAMCVLTGSAAAARIAPVAPTTRLCCYAADALSLAGTLGLVPADSAGNVFLLEPFDPVVFERTVDADGLTYVAPTQAAVDCLTGPDRMPEEGLALLDWMERNERKWRASSSGSRASSGRREP